MPDLLTIEEIPDTRRKRALHALMISTFFSWSGFFLVIPLMAVHYVDHLGWAAASIGVVLAVRQLAQQALTAVFGILADQVGPRLLIAGGMFVRAIGFASMAFADDFLWVLCASAIVGLGGAIFESPSQAAIATLTYPEERRRFFAQRGVVGGIGTTVGTQIGALLIGIDFAWVCLVAGASYVVVAALAYIFVPPVAASTSSEGALGSLKSVFRDKVFMSYVAIVAGYWFVWTQFGLTITLAAVSITGSDRAVSWIYLVSAIITIGLGYTLPRLLERWLPDLHLQIAGILILGIGLMMIGLVSNLAGVLFAAAIFSIGAVMARPGQESVLASLASPSSRGTYFGISSSVFAIGGGLGNFLGGVIYDRGSSGAAALPWIVFGCIAFVTSLLLWRFRGVFGEVRSA